MTKNERRAAMPFTTAIVDEYRAAFGEPERIIAKENGHKIEWRKPRVIRMAENGDAWRRA